MKRKKLLKLNKFIVWFFTFLIIIPSTSWASNFQYEEDVRVIVAGNKDTGEIYYDKNSDEVWPVASMSKLMTYLVVKDDIEEGLYNMDSLVTIDKEAASLNRPGYSHFGLKAGEKIKVEELLEGLMVVSGNDAALALAKNSAKTEKEFSKKMNEKSKEIGLESSNFVNSSGLTNELEIKKDGKTKVNYQSNEMSGKDLFYLAKHILQKYPETEEYGLISTIDNPERGYLGTSTLPLRKSMPGMRGLKTGFTDEAKYGLTGYFDMNLQEEGQDYKLITVVIGAESPQIRARITKEIVGYVQENYRYRKTIDTDRPFVNIEIPSIKDDYLSLYPNKNYERIFSKDDKFELNYKIENNKKAPIKDGEVMGELTLFLNGEEVEKIDLINKGYQPKAGIITRLYKSSVKFIKGLFLMV